MVNPILAPVISNDEIMPGINLLRAEAPAIAAAARPGQFVMVRTSDGYNPLLRRPLSIHRVNDRGEIALLYEVVGKGTEWLAQRRKDDTIDILGPLGHGFDIASQHLLLVAGGVGIAPLIFLAERAVADGRQVRLLFGAKTAQQVYPEKLLPADIEFIPITQDGLIKRLGMVTDVLREFIDSTGQIFACGPSAMYKAMSQMKVLNCKHIQVSLEARMGCGLGLCYGCTIETRQGLKCVCKDGPVFDLTQLFL